MRQRNHHVDMFRHDFQHMDLYMIANRLSFKPGQHFVLDQTASKIIMKNRITTYIIGKNMKQPDNLLKGKKFKGTLIRG